MKRRITNGGEKKPSFNLAINKSRLKNYNVDNVTTYYLKNGDEFQLEIFNPSTNNILAKIKINDNLISQGGLVIRPGERIFLERYLDVSKKFLFETYEVENSDEVKDAIQNNGLIEIEFFRELINNKILLTSPRGLPSRNTFGGPNYYDFTFNDFTYKNDYTYYNQINSFTTNNLSLDTSINTNSLETGRVEIGGESNQNLENVDMSFSTFAFHVDEFKILPISQKINDSSDIVVRTYCSNCGKKQKKGNKFCPYCGSKQ